MKTIDPYKRNRGFSLIELVITMIIIGIIASIGYAKYIDLRDCAKIARCKANQQHLCTAQRLYWVQSSIDNDKGHYAGQIEDLTPFLKDGVLPQCPEDGKYQIVDEYKIVCSIPEHAIR